MSKVLLFIFSFSSIVVFSQNRKTTILDANQASALIHSDGMLFQNKVNGTAQYVIPKDSGVGCFYAGSIWIGGLDESQSLHLAGLRYGQGMDFFPGAVANLSTTESALNYAYRWEKQIWKVTREQIVCHQNNFNKPGYNIPNDILSWPANGIVQYGEAKNLAPFVDLNGDSLYSPELGEYPFVRGDEAVYTIMNDMASKHTETNGEPVGVELHLMAYQYKDTKSFLDSTTFLNYRIINRGVHKYDSLRFSFYTDFDIGNYADDYFQTDVKNNMIFGFNADDFDEDDGGRKGYRKYPPAAGIMLLNRGMDFSTYFTSTSQYPFNDPSTAAQYYNFMTGNWANHSKMFFGGLGYEGSSGVTTTPSKYMFPGVSDDSGRLSTGGIEMSGTFPNGWSEVTNLNPKGDRRGVLTSSPFKLYPGDEACVDFAVLFARSLDSTTSSVIRLGVVADSCKLVFNTLDNVSSCLESVNASSGFQNNCSLVIDTMVVKPGFGPEIKRLDGHGNGNRWLDITAESRDSILQNGYMQQVVYKNGRGPIGIEVIDTSNYLPGKYVLEFKDIHLSPSNSTDSATWILHRTFNGVENMYSGTYNISIDSFQIIPELGLKVMIKQKKYDKTNVPIYNQSTQIIGEELLFSDTSEWLTGIKDNDAFYPTNWVRSGDFTPNVATDCIPNGPDYLNPCNYSDENMVDTEEQFENVLNGILAPHRLVGYQSQYMPLKYYKMTNPGTSRWYASLSFLPSIDLVITPDTSLWTRCPVIELGGVSTLNIGQAEPGGLRKSISKGKDGLPDNTGTTGLSWFPGYAIDVESGARLYLAFGENSSLFSERGADMIWNPTSTLFNNSGVPILGGQHPIYVFGFKNKTINNFSLIEDFPAYVKNQSESAQGNYLYTLLNDVVSTNSALSKRNLYGNLTWVFNPILKEGKTCLENEATIKVRVNKEYKKYMVSGNNSGYPMYEWFNDGTLGMKFFDLTQNELKLYPNPVQSKLILESKNILTNVTIQIIGIDGRILYSCEIGQLTNLSIEPTFSSGVYILNVSSDQGMYSKKFEVVK